MDTPIRIEASGDRATEAVDAAVLRFEELDSLFSPQGSDSDVAAINGSDGGVIAVADDSYAVIERSLELGHHVDGALDITIQPLTEAWGFTEGQGRIPDAEEIAALLPHIGYRHMRLDGERRTIRIDGAKAIDLGAVAKGYACGEAVTTLKSFGITSAIIDAGGTIGTIGTKPDTSPWKIGIRDPHGDASAVVGSLTLQDGFVATSGLYERFVMDGDTRYGHILDPSTGMPADTDLASVSIVSEDATLCDGLSTALFVLGPERAADLWRSGTEFESILVYQNGAIEITEGLEHRFTLDDHDRTVEVIRR